MNNTATGMPRKIVDKAALARFLQALPRGAVPGRSRVVDTRTGSVVLLQRPQRARRPDASAAHADKDSAS